jgi:cell division septation protein DedD
VPPEQTPEPPRRRRRIELNGVQVLAAVAAAVSAAVAASALGVAGTVAGTALVSVIATVGNALYTASLRRTSDTLKEAQVKVLKKVAPTMSMSTARLSDPGDGAAAVAATSEALAESAAEHEAEGHEGTGDRPRRRSVPRRVAVLAGSAVAVFVLAFAVLTGIEAVMGQSFASLFGHDRGSGTTAGTLLGSGKLDKHQGTANTGDTGTRSKSPSPTPSATSHSPTPAPTTPSARPSQPATTTPPASPVPTPTGTMAPTTPPAGTPSAPASAQ